MGKGRKRHSVGPQSEQKQLKKTTSGAKANDGLLPVSLLCGFLGAGKTTLLKHILETKHGEGAFKCAVIVNDMAELNIDKNLIDRSSFVQSDEVIAMENGCVCCTLKSDLVDQIKALAARKTFDYMIIEASGVSEPAQVAKLFADCDDEHDHTEEHTDMQLGDLARLDTCVTVVDAAEFYNNLEVVKTGPSEASLPELLVEQVQYSNVIILNKTDLVVMSQLAKIKDQVCILNPKARVITSNQSRIDVKEVVDTKLFNAADFSLGLFQPFEESEEKKAAPVTFGFGGGGMAKCCVATMAGGKSSCCSQSRTIISKKSKVVLSPTTAKLTRHESRFGICSFLFSSRRPFHPVRFHENFMTKFFVFLELEQEDYSKRAVRRRQKEALTKQKLRTNLMGGILRSKGFVWLANAHDLEGTISQAGNMVTIDLDSSRWDCLSGKAWEGTDEEKATFRKTWVEPFGDRRQGLVFIGQDLKHKVIQEVLDECLLTDEEMALGVDGWKAIMGCIILDADDGEEEDEFDEDVPLTRGRLQALKSEMGMEEE